MQVHVGEGPLGAAPWCYSLGRQPPVGCHSYSVLPARAWSG